ncbi:sugar-transfer associated ATP-grasp domain-containing protein [Candidatus Laterigemmans baculatus]|uniref:sugar-transfer associated ATP-grasp domain-containing protein n=1 Tax=Candidatus Laterigemmans baculatus TaxID=2770505 RepID=UPI0013DB78C5|nr:sugar-transfer associated ATP-grasp domain-containing protein [Candidatus Laterigemmans baculatus]
MLPWFPCAVNGGDLGPLHRLAFPFNGKKRSPKRRGSELVYLTIKHVAKRVVPATMWTRLYGRWWDDILPFTVEHCPMMLPWFASAKRNDPASRLHRLALCFDWQKKPSFCRTFCVWIASLFWPFRFFSETLQALRRYGPGTRRMHGLSCRMQFFEIVRHGMTSNVPASAYYLYRLFLPANRHRANLWIHKEELLTLYDILMSGLPSDRPLSDKQAFLEGGLEHGLPVVHALAVFGPNRFQKWYTGAAGDLPRCDLVLKPVDLLCGRGFQLWTFDEDTGNWRKDGKVLDKDAFLKYCFETAGQRRQVLQVRLRNHGLLAPLASEGLCTIRTISFCRPGGDPELLMACLRMPTGASHVDNFQAGGIAALIDLETGSLGSAVAKDPTRGTFEHHPDTGAPITGTKVPLFPEAVALSLRAHALYPWMPFVGWDVVITPSGPCLLEANPGWCVELAQVVSGVPLGETVCPEIYLEHLAAQEQASLATSPLPSSA